MFEQLAFRFSPVSTSSWAAPPARTSQALANKRVCLASARASCSSISGSSASCAPLPASPRTCTAGSGAPGWTRFGAASRAPGTRSALENFGLLTSARRTSAPASSLWPTLTVDGNHNRKGASATSGDWLATAVKRWATLTARDANGPQRGRNAQGAESLAAQATGGASSSLNPEWCEPFMGYPVGWTVIGGPLVAAKPSRPGSRRARSKDAKRIGEPG